MSVEPIALPLLGNTNLPLRPFAQRMAEQCPELWAKFVRACERERATEEGISQAEFIHRCTVAASTVNASLDGELVAERSN